MLKREVTYVDFNDEEVRDTLYFNISKAELIELQASVEGGMGNFLQRISETRDNVQLVEQYKRLILMAYGEKSDDGKHFFKTDENKAKFAQSAAYQELFMQLAEDQDVAFNFFTAIFPKDVMQQVDQDKPKTTPVTTNTV